MNSQMLNDTTALDEREGAIQMRAEQVASEMRRGLDMQLLSQAIGRAMEHMDERFAKALLAACCRHELGELRQLVDDAIREEAWAYAEAEMGGPLMGNWTPGPWKVGKYEANGGSGLGIDSANGDAVVWYSRKPDDGIHYEHDAYLIASAPELYEALSWVVHNYRRTLRVGPVRDADECIHRAEKALSKARGESHD